VSHTIEEYAPGVILILGEPNEREKMLTQGLLGMGAPVVSLSTDHGLTGHVNIVQSIPDLFERIWKLPNIRARLVKRESPELPVPSGPIFRRETLPDEEVEVRVHSSKNGFIAVIPSDIEKTEVRTRAQRVTRLLNGDITVL
jgi:hypothetical protein